MMRRSRRALEDKPAKPPAPSAEHPAPAEALRRVRGRGADPTPRLLDHRPQVGCKQLLDFAVFTTFIYFKVDICLVQRLSD